MDPITTGLVAQALKRASESGKEKLIDLFYSDVGAFLKVLKRKIGGDTTVPWDQIDSARVNPEFIGIAKSLIDANSGARNAMREFIATLELPDSHEDPDAVREKIFKASEYAAIEAVRSDREALLATQRKIEETIENRDSEETFQRREDQLKIRLRGALESTFQAHGTRKELDPDEIRAQVEAKIWSQDSVGGHPGPDPVATSASSGRQPLASASSLGLELPAADEKLIDQLLEKLDSVDPAGGAVLRALLGEGGMDSVVQNLTSAEFEGRSAALLDAEARLAGIHGAFGEAENAHLAAADLRDTASDKARQLARAAAMASALGEESRAEAHRHRAEGISPGHPAVAIADARANSDPAETLRLLDGIVPESDREASVVHTSRAQAYLGQGEFTKAQEELDAASQIDPDDLAVREVQAMLPWLRAREQFARGGVPDTKALLYSSRVFREMATDLAAHNRETEQGQLLARAAECSVMAGDPDVAVEALELAPDPEGMSSEAKAALGNAAMLAARPDLAASFTVGASEDDPDGLVLADAQLHSNSPRERKNAAARLVDLLDSSDDEVRDQAAYSLLSGTLEHFDIAWNERAAEIVRARNPAVAAILRAELHASKGEFKEAEAVLLPHAGDSRSQRALAHYAEERQDWPKARDRLAELAKTRGEEAIYLRLAKATYLSGSLAEARDIYLRLARDPELDEALRGAAFSGAVEVAGRGSDFEEIRKLSEEWHRELPGDENGIWNLMFALARLARHEEAYELSLTARPDANTAERATLYAEIFSRAAPGAEALRSIAALSDRYERKVEALEGLFIATALQVEQEDGTQIDERMGERIRETLESFPERFPDQTLMQSFEAPESADDFERLLEEHGAGNTAQRQRQVYREIVDGVQPVNTLSAVAPSLELGRAWAGLTALPLGFAHEPTDQAERKLIAAAIGSAVVWDSSAMFLSGGLGQEHLELVRGLFPGSRIAQETLEDADAAQASTPRKGHMETVQDPDTGAFQGLRESSDGEVQRIAAINVGMVSLARLLDPEPWLEEHADERLAEMYERSEGHRSWQAMTASIALAKRLGMPLFSDDRWIRNAAPAFGVEAFGTVALLDVLAEKGAIDSKRRIALRRTLLAAGGWGLAPTREEMIEIVRESDFSLNRGAIGALSDRAAWRSHPVPYLHNALGLLQVIFEEDRDNFEKWALRILDALQMTTPELPKGEAAKILLALAWDLNGSAELSPAALRALIEVISHLPPWMTDIDAAPAARALDFILESLPTGPPQVRAMLFARVIGQLSLEDADQAIQRYVEPPSPDLD